MKYLIGLGNPGNEYIDTRHNVGFLILDEIHSAHSFSDWKKDPYLNALICTGTLYEKEYTLIKPLTYMNLSGTVIHTLLKRDTPLEDIVVVYDDLAYPFGIVRLAYDKGAAGHNGVTSLLEHAKHPFLRIRVGIHSYIPGSREELVRLVGTARSDFVLKEFRPDEKESIPSIAKKVMLLIQSLDTFGIAKTMTDFNARG